MFLSSYLHGREGRCRVAQAVFHRFPWPLFCSLSWKTREDAYVTQRFSRVNIKKMSQKRFWVMMLPVFSPHDLSGQRTEN